VENGSKTWFKTLVYDIALHSTPNEIPIYEQKVFSLFNQVALTGAQTPMSPQIAGTVNSLANKARAMPGQY
jgi:hypothetical protein